MTIEIDFLQKKSTDSSPYDSDKMAAEFIQQFNNQAFSVTQQVGDGDIRTLSQLDQVRSRVIRLFLSVFSFHFKSARLQLLRQALWLNGEGH